MFAPYLAVFMAITLCLRRAKSARARAI